MHNFTTNPAMRRLIDEAHAERNAAVRTFFASLFSWKDSPAHTAAQAA